jgi:hypothetical protein
VPRPSAVLAAVMLTVRVSCIPRALSVWARPVTDAPCPERAAPDRAWRPAELVKATVVSVIPVAADTLAGHCKTNVA